MIMRGDPCRASAGVKVLIRISVDNGTHVEAGDASLNRGSVEQNGDGMANKVSLGWGLL